MSDCTGAGGGGLRMGMAMFRCSLANSCCFAEEIYGDEKKLIQFVLGHLNAL